MCSSDLQASLSGQVLLSTSGPAANYSVRLYLSSSYPVGTPTRTTTTDANGRYTFSDVNAPEDYIVAIYSSPTSQTVLDVILVTSIPGVDTTVGVLIGA